MCDIKQISEETTRTPQAESIFSRLSSTTLQIYCDNLNCMLENIYLRNALIPTNLENSNFRSLQRKLDYYCAENFFGCKQRNTDGSWYHGIRKHDVILNDRHLMFELIYAKYVG